VPQNFEEPILIYLEMLKIFFPAGLQIQTTDSHSEYQTKCDLLSEQHHLSNSDRTSILMISRIFSLLTINCKSIDEDGVQLDFEANSLDFDLSQFNTYVRTLKFMMKSMFQTIMYRMFR
jgi:Temperature dependent protein affecting M2 dsRNA replication